MTVATKTLKNLFLMLLLTAAFAAIALCPLYIHGRWSWVFGGGCTLAFMVFCAYQAARIEVKGEPRMRFELTPEQFETLRGKAGIAAGDTSGTIEKQGVKAHWIYDGGALDVAILKKPMLVPESLIAARFRSWAGIS